MIFDTLMMGEDLPSRVTNIKILTPNKRVDSPIFFPVLTHYLIFQVHYHPPGRFHPQGKDRPPSSLVQEDHLATEIRSANSAAAAVGSVSLAQKHQDLLL